MSIRSYNDATKKIRERRAYLDDFEKDRSGKYVYTGKLHYYKTEMISRENALIYMWLMTLIMAVGIVFAGLNATSSMSNTLYVVLPYAGSLITALMLVWLMYRLTRGGDPLRDYVFRDTVVKMRQRGLFMLFFSFLTLLGYGICIFLHNDEPDFKNPIFFICDFFCLCASFAWLKFIKKLSWSE